jgi:hypothetical protein
MANRSPGLLRHEIRLQENGLETVLALAKNHRFLQMMRTKEGLWANDPLTGQTLRQSGDFRRPPGKIA